MECCGAGSFNLGSDGSFELEDLLVTSNFTV